MSGETAIQSALYSALNGLGLKVVDAQKQAADGASTTPFPYVEIGFILLSPFDDRAKNGFSYLARVHTRSRSKSMKETKDIQGQIYDCLHYGALTVTGFNHILIQRERSEVMRAPDGSYHGVCEYRGLITKP